MFPASLLQIIFLLVIIFLPFAGAQAQALAGGKYAEAWGLEQVGRMLADQTVMKTYEAQEAVREVTPDAAIWKWAANHFAGQVTGFWAEWDTTPPGGTVAAQHVYAKDKVHIHARLPEQAADYPANMRFEIMWSQVVFELLNMENAQGFSDLDVAVRQGKCTKQDYILRHAELEYEALGKLQHFFTTVWQPWAKEAGFASDARIWQRNYHPDFGEWMKCYPPDAEYPWQSYGIYFDKLEAERLAAAKAGTSPAAKPEAAAAQAPTPGRAK